MNEDAVMKCAKFFHPSPNHLSFMFHPFGILYIELMTDNNDFAPEGV